MSTRSRSSGSTAGFGSISRSRVPSCVLSHRASLSVPDLSCVFGDGAVAGEPAGRCYVQDRLMRPSVPISVKLENSSVGLEVGTQVCKVHVVVAAGEQLVAQRPQDARLMAAEIVVKDQIERRVRFGFVVVVPMRVVPAAGVGHLLRGQAKEGVNLLAAFPSQFDRRGGAR